MITRVKMKKTPHTRYGWTPKTLSGLLLQPEASKVSQAISDGKISSPHHHVQLYDEVFPNFVKVTKY